MATRLAQLPPARTAHAPSTPPLVKRGIPDAERRAIAEQKAFRYLEDRWRRELKGRKIPKSYRKKMRRDPNFERVVDEILAGNGVAAFDLAATPNIERHPDGSVTNRMEEELGGDPREYLCPECGGEKDTPGREPCPACVKFQQKLYEV